LGLDRENADAATKLADHSSLGNWYYSCSASEADTWASEWLVGVIKNRQRMTGGKPRPAFVVSQQVVGTNFAGEIGEVLEDYDLPLLDGRTSQRVAYAEALSVGTTVLDVDPNSKASAEVRQITQETLQLINTTETTHV